MIARPRRLLPPEKLARDFKRTPLVFLSLSR
jgi:hypothetical protein